MSIRDRLQVNLCDSFRALVKENWKIALLPADPDYLTEEFENLLSYCHKYGLNLSAEFYLCPSDNNDSTEILFNLKSRSKEEIIKSVRQYAFIYDGLFLTSDEKIIFFMTHDEFGMFMGDESAILQVTGNDSESLNDIFKDYIKEWKGVLRHNLDKLLSAAKNYPENFEIDSLIEILF